MDFITNDGLKLHYELRGNRSAGETIVFLNGLTQSTVAWSLCLPYFTDRYQILLLDFIFQGDSDKTGEWRSFDQHARDLASLLDQLALSKVHVVGISYGSLVAQHFALKFPEKLRKLVLISTFAHKTPYYEAIELSWWRALEAGGYKLMLDIMLPSVLSEDYFEHPLIPINKLKEARTDLNQNAAAIFKLMRATKERGDYRKQLQKIKAKTCIIQGERDQLFPVHNAEEVKKSIPGSELVVIKNAGHTLNLEHVPEVCQKVNEFLQKVE